jgi:hypothetical protein
MGRRGSYDRPAMASWREITEQAPELAQAVRERLEAHRHKTLATLRRDGSPRISGTETKFAEGELWFGSMWRAVKALDLQRDPRFALHSGSDEPDSWRGDAKVAGRAEEISDPAKVEAINRPGVEAPPGPSHLFRADLDEVVLVRLGDPPDHLVIETWHAGRGVRRIERR